MNHRIEAFVTDRQYSKSGKITEVIGRALEDVALGDQLVIGKGDVRSVYTIRKLEAYRKSVDMLSGMYGGIVSLELMDGPGRDFEDGDILFFEQPDWNVRIHTNSSR